MNFHNANTNHTELFTGFVASEPVSGLPNLADPSLEK